MSACGLAPASHGPGVGPANRDGAADAVGGGAADAVGGGAADDAAGSTGDGDSDGDGVGSAAGTDGPEAGREFRGSRKSPIGAGVDGRDVGAGDACGSAPAMVGACAGPSCGSLPAITNAAVVRRTTARVLDPSTIAAPARGRAGRTRMPIAPRCQDSTPMRASSMAPAARSSDPTGSAWPASGPNGSPTARDASQTMRAPALTAIAAIAARRRGAGEIGNRPGDLETGQPDEGDTKRRVLLEMGVDHRQMDEGGTQRQRGDDDCDPSPERDLGPREQAASVGQDDREDQHAEARGQDGGARDQDIGTDGDGDGLDVGKHRVLDPTPGGAGRMLVQLT